MDWADEIATKIAGDFFSQTEGTNLHRGIAAALRKAKAAGMREAAEIFIDEPWGSDWGCYKVWFQVHDAAYKLENPAGEETP